ncbi:unnamed protein product [Rhodiola kirilowii]
MCCEEAFILSCRTFLICQVFHLFLVINGLTDFNHPCQIMADALTMIEHIGALGRNQGCLCWRWKQHCALLAVAGCCRAVSFCLCLPIRF